MTKIRTTMLAATIVSTLALGCTGRIIREGMGTATGASGKVVDSGSGGSLSQYKSLAIGPITVAGELKGASHMPPMIQGDLNKVVHDRHLDKSSGPGLKMTGEIVHYEAASAVSTVADPLEEVIVRATFTDAATGETVAQTNLIGRAKATTSSGDRSLAAGVGKALDEWLEQRGMR
jgi:hypothetical protein